MIDSICYEAMFDEFNKLCLNQESDFVSFLSLFIYFFIFSWYQNWTKFNQLF